MAKKKVLFVCIHNSARSQMAEAFLNDVCGHEFEAFSAGIEPGKLNPIVIAAMQELGIDISQNQTKAVLDMIKSGPPSTQRDAMEIPTALDLPQVSASEVTPIRPTPLKRPDHSKMPAPASPPAPAASDGSDINDWI